MKSSARLMGWVFGQLITACMAALAVIAFLPVDQSRRGEADASSVAGGPVVKEIIADAGAAVDAQEAASPEREAPSQAAVSSPEPEDAGASLDPQIAAEVDSIAAEAAAALAEGVASEATAEASSETATPVDVPPGARPAPSIGAVPAPLQSVVADDAEASGETTEELAPAEEAGDAREAAAPGASGPVRTAASLCEEPRLVGVAIDPLSDANESACGAEEPVEIEALRVAGGEIKLSPPLVSNCKVGRLMASWVEETVVPAAQTHFDEPLQSIEIAAGYSCRRRNNGGADKPFSEHAFANAVDMSAFTLSSGRRVTVKDGWIGAKDEVEFLRALWWGACEIFTTVLGPEADAAHEDHFHFDAKERTGHFCQ